MESEYTDVPSGSPPLDADFVPSTLESARPAHPPKNNLTRLVDVDSFLINNSQKFPAAGPESTPGAKLELYLFDGK